LRLSSGGRLDGFLPLRRRRFPIPSWDGCAAKISWYRVSREGCCTRLLTLKSLSAELPTLPWLGVRRLRCLTRVKCTPGTLSPEVGCLKWSTRDMTDVWSDEKSESVG
jgi:hypothetical protein